MSTIATDTAATDTAGRRGRDGAFQPFRIGSDQHKTLFCRTLLDTHNPYKPAVIDWPKLDDAARDRLVSLPIWDIAVQTEGKAGIRVGSYGGRVTDPLLKEAITMNAFEERRHKHVLANMVEAYGIRLAPEPPYPPPRYPQWAFMVTGYAECIDSVFAFGLFELAKRSGYFPPALVDTFEPVMAEEARHILFFVNWVAWYRKNLPWWKRPWFVARCFGVWVFLIWERLGLVKSVGGTADNHNFMVTGTSDLGIDVKPRAILDVCLAENDRRMNLYDARLLRPKIVPPFIRMIRRLL